MNKQAIIWLVVAVVVIGGVVLYSKGKSTSYAPGYSAVSDSSSQTITTTTTTTNGGAFTGSMKDLVARNQPVSCTFTSPASSANTQGTIYVANGKVRSNFSVTASGQTFQAYMISDGLYSYVWSSILPQGFKTPLANASAQASTAPSQGVDYNQSLNFNCQPWTADITLFVPPTNVTFVTQAKAQ